MDGLYAYRSPLKDNPPQAGEPLGTPLTRRLVIVLVDALRLDTALDEQTMPFLAELSAQGAWGVMHSRAPSFSQPAYTVIFTGAWPDISDGPVINVEYASIPTWTQDDLFSAAHRAGLSAAISGYYWFEKLVPQAAVVSSFYTPGEDRQADVEVMGAALSWLDEEEHELILIHLDQVDYAGHHEGGPRDPRWKEAAARVDGMIAETAARLDLTQDTLLVLSDHGQIDAGGHGGPERSVVTEPFIFAGAGVRQGEYPDLQMVDVAPTMAALLGTNLPASAQGRPLVEMLTLPAERQAAVEQAYMAQQTRLAETYIAAIGGAAASEGISPQEAMQAARAARLGRERIPRGILVLFLAVLPPALWMRRNQKVLAALLAGALVYLALFHGLYALAAGMTYSLSSVSSSEGLISLVAGAALTGLAAAWLLAMSLASPGKPGFAWRDGPERATRMSLALTWLILYLQALPVMWHVFLNGVRTTWTLPDFPSAYFAFLSLFQIGVVSAGGVTLVIVAALTGWIVRRQA
ncbi:MAG: alkaline phosphatase family protein [Chloroflexi bacterium]|nr:alkaline phosphatase family protein [Chloroflexota bacterium]